MRKTLTATGLAAVLVLGAGAAPAAAAAKPNWRVTYVSPETGNDDFALYGVVATGRYDAWAVGSRQQGGGAGGAIMHWNGWKWHDVKIPGSAGYFQAVGGSSPWNVWVLGDTRDGAETAWHWNGWKWTATPTPGYRVGDVAVLGRDDAWAVGGDDNNDNAKANALHWDGKKWKKVPMPRTALKIGAVSKNDLWAVGEGTRDQPYAAHWNGKKWTASTLPKVTPPKGSTGFSYFNDVTVLSKNNVWAVGRFYYRAPKKAGHNRPVLMHWNGKKWSLSLGRTGDFAMSSASDGAGGIWYSSIYDKFVHRTKSGQTTTYAAPVPSGRPAVEIRAITALPGGKVLAVGQAQPKSGGVDQTWDALVEQYGR